MKNTKKTKEYKKVKNITKLKYTTNEKYWKQWNAFPTIRYDCFFRTDSYVRFDFLLETYYDPIFFFYRQIVTVQANTQNRASNGSPQTQPPLCEG